MSFKEIIATKLIKLLIIAKKYAIFLIFFHKVSICAQIWRKYNEG